MAEAENIYLKLNTTQILLRSFGELSSSGDTVVVSIYDIDDATLDVNEASMTYVNGTTWKYSWSAPNQSHVYEIVFFDKTLNIKHTVYARLVGDVTGIPSASTAGDTLADLRKEFLIATVDSYNADEGTGDGTNKDLARRCLNLAAQRIYSIVKDTKFMESNPSSLTATTSQQYIELSGITDLDEILSIYDSTNNFRLTKRPMWWLREFYGDGSQSAGTPIYYARLFNRIYLGPTPSSAIVYNPVDYKKNIGNMSADSDRVGIPLAFNRWLYAEAHVFWQKNDDPRDYGTLRELRSIAKDEKEIAMEDINDAFDEVLQSESHFQRAQTRQVLYDSPIDGT